MPEPRLTKQQREDDEEFVHDACIVGKDLLDHDRIEESVKLFEIVKEVAEELQKDKGDN